MKNIIRILMLITCVSLFQSCEEEQIEVVRPPAYEFTWTDTAELNFAPQGEENNFVYSINESTGDQFWGVTDLTFDVSFESQYGTIADISKIDIYAFIEEEVSGATNYIGGNTGKLIESISNPEGTFQVNLSKDELYSMFQNDFSSGRSDLVPGDLIELKWVITGTDGSIIDTRKDCVGFECTYGFQVTLNIVDTWVGEFEATWIEVGSGTERYSYTGVVQGAKRLVNFAPGDNEGEYKILDMSFGGAYGGPRDGIMTWDSETGTITITYAESYYKSQYELVSVTPEVLTLKWTNNFSTFYSEFGTVELRRFDELSWPDVTTIINFQ